MHEYWFQENTTFEKAIELLNKLNNFYKSNPDLDETFDHHIEITKSFSSQVGFLKEKSNINWVSITVKTPKMEDLNKFIKFAK